MNIEFFGQSVTGKRDNNEDAFLAEKIGDYWVFVVAGLGGGVGSGPAPEIARLARKRGAFVIALVTFTFRIQEMTIRKAEAGLQNLLRNTDTVVIKDNLLSSLVRPGKRQET